MAIARVAVFVCVQGGLCSAQLPASTSDQRDLMKELRDSAVAGLVSGAPGWFRKSFLDDAISDLGRRKPQRRITSLFAGAARRNVWTFLKLERRWERLGAEISRRDLELLRVGYLNCLRQKKGLQRLSRFVSWAQLATQIASAQLRLTRPQCSELHAYLTDLPDHVTRLALKASGALYSRVAPPRKQKILEEMVEICLLNDLMGEAIWCAGELSSKWGIDTMERGVLLARVRLRYGNIKGAKATLEFVRKDQEKRRAISRAAWEKLEKAVRREMQLSRRGIEHLANKSRDGQVAAIRTFMKLGRFRLARDLGQRALDQYGSYAPLLVALAETEMEHGHDPMRLAAILKRTKSDTAGFRLVEATVQTNVWCTAVVRAFLGLPQDLAWIRDQGRALTLALSKVPRPSKSPDLALVEVLVAPVSELVPAIAVGNRKLALSRYAEVKDAIERIRRNASFPPTVRGAAWYCLLSFGSKSDCASAIQDLDNAPGPVGYELEEALALRVLDGGRTGLGGKEAKDLLGRSRGRASLVWRFIRGRRQGTECEALARLFQEFGDDRRQTNRHRSAAWNNAGVCLALAGKKSAAEAALLQSEQLSGKSPSVAMLNRMRLGGAIDVSQATAAIAAVVGATRRFGWAQRRIIMSAIPVFERAERDAMVHDAKAQLNKITSKHVYGDFENELLCLDVAVRIGFRIRGFAVVPVFNPSFLTWLVLP